VVQVCEWSECAAATQHLVFHLIIDKRSESSFYSGEEDSISSAFTKLTPTPTKYGIYFKRCYADFSIEAEEKKDGWLVKSDSQRANDPSFFLLSQNSDYTLKVFSHKSFFLLPRRVVAEPERRRVHRTVCVVCVCVCVCVWGWFPAWPSVRLSIYMCVCISIWKRKKKLGERFGPGYLGNGSTRRECVGIPSQILSRYSLENVLFMLIYREQELVVREDFYFKVRRKERAKRVSIETES